MNAHQKQYDEEIFGKRMCPQNIVLIYKHIWMILSKAQTDKGDPKHKPAVSKLVQISFKVLKYLIRLTWDDDIVPQYIQTCVRDLKRMNTALLVWLKLI